MGRGFKAGGIAGLSLRAGVQVVFPPAVLNADPGYFHRKIEEK